MIKNILAILFFLTAFIINAQDSTYMVEIDLQKVTNDQVSITVYPPASGAQFVEYHLAKIVPGTYEVSDFGRFVTDFYALSKGGDTLDVEALSTNRWKISHNGELEKITYNMHDTWDDFKGYGDNIIFEPGGTNIDGNDEAYVINPFGFIGYLKDHQFKPYKVKVYHHPEIYGSSALEKERVNDTTDVFYAQDFNFLADGPVMYNVPDTVSKKIANAEVLVSVYSPNNALTAREVMSTISDLMEAQSKYLGGELPVDRYAFLIFLNDEMTLSGAMGALEHSYSSLYSLPEAGADRLAQTIRDVSAHEFFHIVTPLNIHSEEIGSFNYIEPEMSKHLWLYEGVTEYSSMHVQVKYNLYGPDKFLDEIRQKILVAQQYPKNVPFTVMSENILEPEYEEMYSNVYYKGALIGMCLDLYLIKYSNGERDLQWLMRELSKKYGRNQSFEDDQLFNVIEELTYPEIGEFLKTYVAGDSPLPLKEVLGWAGVNFAEERMRKVITLGGLRLNVNEERQIIIQSLEDANEFAKDLKLKEGDIWVALNGEEITLATYQDAVDKFKESNPGDKVTYTVLRKKKNGKLKEKKLKAKAVEIDHSEKFVVAFLSDPTPEQAKILQHWIIAEK